MTKVGVRLIYRHGSRVVHIKVGTKRTLCGIAITDQATWHDEGEYLGKPFETMCGRCRRSDGWRTA